MSFNYRRDMVPLWRETDHGFTKAKRRGRNRVVRGGNIDIGPAYAKVISPDLAPGA